MHSTKPVQTKRFKFPTAIRNIVLVISIILILDIVVASVWVTFLTKQGWYTIIRTLSDLLFVEGAVIFAAGSFMLLATSKIKLSTCKRVIIVGAGAIGLAIAIGTLLL